DAPMISSGPQAGAITELANPIGSSTPDQASGTVTFTDVDLSDKHTATVAGVVSSGVTSGLPDIATILSWLSSDLLTDTTGTGVGGSDTWSFSAVDKSFDYLAAGEILTLIYTVQIADNHGGTAPQNVVITITGTNDTPVITSSAQTGTISRSGAVGSNNPDTENGAVTFTDVDLSDIHTATVTGVTTSGVTSGLPNTATLLSWLSLSPLTAPPATDPGGSDPWAFSAPDKSFDYLAQDQTVTL